MELIARGNLCAALCTCTLGTNDPTSYIQIEKDDDIWETKLDKWDIAVNKVHGSREEPNELSYILAGFFQIAGFYRK